MPLSSLIHDPPPLLVFEIDEDGVTGVRRNPKTRQVDAGAERSLEPGVIEASPARPNVHAPKELEQAIGELLEELGPVRRPETALILPDGASRLTVIDFDNLPNDGEERLKLIRFRLARAVPFDVKEARIAYRAEKTAGGYAVLAALTPPEIVRQYEEVFERAGLWTGYVTGSTAATLNLIQGEGMTLLAKLSGKALTMAAIDNGVVRMIRGIEVAFHPEAVGRTLDDILADLFPTLIFVQDNLRAPVDKLLLCGFGELLPAALERLPRELGCEVEPLRSLDGVCGPRDAGIRGYLSLS